MNVDLPTPGTPEMPTRTAGLSVDGASVGGDAHGVEQVVYGVAASFAGSVSAEHGIGLHKKAYLGASRTPTELATMRAIKAALDPLNIMNPGKVFDAASPTP